MHSKGEKCCTRSLSACPVPGPEEQGHSSGCSELSVLGMPVWHTQEVAAGGPMVSTAAGSWGVTPNEKQVWLCRNKPVLESVFLREGLFCLCQHWCAQSSTEHCFRRENLRCVGGTCRPWQCGHRRCTEEIYWYSALHPPLLPQTWGREVPAGSCAGSKGTKHRAPMLSFCLS